MIVTGPRRVTKLADDSSMYVLVSIMNGIGDGLLALPVIRWLERAFGHQRVVIWATRTLLNTSLSGIECRGIWTIEDGTGIAAPNARREVERLIRSMGQGHPPTIWVSLNSYRPRTTVESIGMAALSPRYVYGFYDGSESSHTLDNFEKLHRGDQLFRVIGESITPSSAVEFPYIDEIALRKMKRKVDSFKSGKRGLIAIHADTALNKRWHNRKWRRLVALLRKGNWSVLALGRAPKSLLSGDSGISACPTGWRSQVAALHLADYFVGIDSCFAHVADAMRKPGIVLFGPTSVPLWGPRSGALRTIVAPGCRMSSLNPETVFSAFLREFN